MLNSLFNGLFDSTAASVISVSDFLLCVAIALVCGLILALVHKITSEGKSTSGFLQTLAILPAVVCVIILLVNGNIGTGVAVAGAFSLVRFRSMPGTAREIGALFLAMGTGLIAGMGYLAYAVLFTVVLSLITFGYHQLGFGEEVMGSTRKSLRITIPESLDYTNVFEDILNHYTISHELTQVKTTNMGSLFRLSYNIVLKDASKEKAMVDELRCRNGNLEISVSMQAAGGNEL